MTCNGDYLNLSSSPKNTTTAMQLRIASRIL